MIIICIWHICILLKVEGGNINTEKKYICRGGHPQEEKIRGLRTLKYGGGGSIYYKKILVTVL